MLEIEIKIVRPLRMLFIIGGTVGLVLWAQSFVEEKTVQANAVGGPLVIGAEEQIYRQRTLQAVLDRREEILRYQLRVLEQERDQLSSEWTEQQEKQWRESRELLLGILSDRRKSEEYVRRALLEIWESEGRALASSTVSLTPLRLSWPVEPSEGLSATFLSKEYEEQFGLPHKGIDIPVPQGTTIRAPADGIVEEVADNDFGFSYLVLRHAGGSTLYGHVVGFFVNKGQFVRRGDPIARSGGRPGTRGAGPLSTGPHVHFEVIRNGMHVDPLTVLPAW